MKTIQEVLSDPAASHWLKAALRSALERDAVDAANDAEVLAELLVARSQRLLCGSDWPGSTKGVHCSLYSGHTDAHYSVKTGAMWVRR